MRRFTLSLLAALIAACALAAVPARASTTEESLFQDDNHLLYSSTATVTRTLDALHALGVDRLRLTILWAAVAPSPLASRKPNFDATNPAAYPSGSWGRYDQIVKLAAARGIAVDFNLTGPGPYWAATARAPAAQFKATYMPSAKAFGDFVTAVARRYSGSYVPPAASGPPRNDLGGVLSGVGLGGLQVAAPPTADAAASRTPLPRVNYWTVWNEPDQGGWLTPQWRRSGRRQIEESPVLYRSLLDHAYSALGATGHGGDTILIGETAPKGTGSPGVYSPMKPMVFLRALYCISSSYKPLRGARAGELGCPTSGSPSDFAAAHPALFQATGFAHHPYSLLFAPSVPSSDRDIITLADLPRLESFLDRTFRAYGSARHIPVYITEYGYQTNPPDPYMDVSPGQQAVYLNQAEYLAYSNGRVKSMTQFLLYDDPPDKHFAATNTQYWRTFQSGLYYANHKPKPALAAYRLPIWLPHSTQARGGTTFVWGKLRPAARGSAQYLRIEFIPAHGRHKIWRALATITVRNVQGFFTARLRVPAGGALRIAWRNPRTGALDHSRAAPIHVR
jgi:hypothetical protein